MERAYVEVIDAILVKQAEAIGLSRVLEIAKRHLRDVTLDGDGRVDELRDPARALKEVVEAFLTSFPLSKSVIRMQLMQAKARNQSLLLPEVG